MPLAALSETVNVIDVVPELPSVTVWSEIETEGGPSSSTIVPVPLPSVIVAPVAPESWSVNVSSFSSSVSPSTATSTVFVVWPAVNVTVVSLSEV